MDQIYKGKSIVYGNNVDTDVIIPARFLNTSDPGELAKHCMADIDPTFADKVEPGDIMVAGTNFGCGSSREHAPISIKESGISCIIAETFARIFFRNAINIGLPIIELKHATGLIGNGDLLEVDLTKGVIKNITKDEAYEVSPHPDFMQEIIKNGGLINMVKKQLETGQ